MRHRCLLICCLGLFAPTLLPAAAPPIQDWIDEAVKAGGGVVTIPPGEHVLPKGLVIRDAKKLALRGMEKEACILKLPPLVHALSAAETAAGAGEIAVSAAQGWEPGMRARIEAAGEPDSFTQKPKPFFVAEIKAVEGGRLLLKAPLGFPVPPGTIIRHEDAPNLIEFRGACEGVEVANLTLDGGRVAGDPPVQGHAQLCGVMAAGAYTYEKGPTGPKVKDLEVRDCILQNFFGRGVAFYSVENSSVQRCSFRDGNDEAVDFDHFSTGCVARGNQVTRWRVAFELNDANGALVEGNEVRDCALGLSLWRWCKQPGLNEGNVVRNNGFTGIAGNGFQIGTGTAKNVFEGNLVENAGRNGFSLAGEAQVLKGNTISGAGLKPVVIIEGRHQVEGKTAAP